MSSRVTFLLASLWAASPAFAKAPAPDTPAKESQTPEPPPEPPAPPATPELPAPPPEQAPAAEAPPGEISLDEWNRDDWLLVKPSTSMLELNGYFRLRGDLFRKLNFGNNAGIEPEAPTNTGPQPLVPTYPPVVGGDANLNWTDMRLRVQPQINVTDHIQIFTTIDVLDNLVLGSTPNTVPPPSGEPADSVLSTTQVPVHYGVNSLSDAIAVKRVWARLTALNDKLELRFGRMPNQWGLGMYANDGDCLDCDYGDVADRIALTFRAADHLFTPMFDWVSAGALRNPFPGAGLGLGQPVDQLDSDDAVQYSLRIQRVEHPEDVADKLRQGKAVLTYGLWNIFRTQSRGETGTYYTNWEPGKPLDTNDAKNVSKRNAFIYTVDGYAKLWAGPFKLAAEFAFTYGKFEDLFFGPDDLLQSNELQLGGVLEASWQMPGQRPGSALSLTAGGASGDSAPGFGAFNAAYTQRGVFGGQRDLDINNFQFSPDYHVDLLLFRRIIGTVTDAWYVRPGVSYMFDDKFAGKLGVIYSQAMFGRSTPGHSKPLGVEVDSEISYGLENRTADQSPFAASLAGGVLFPFSAFKNPQAPEDQQDPSYVWTIQGRAYILF